MAFDQVKMLQQLRKAQKQLGKEIIEVEAGDGAVIVQITGELKIKSVKIDQKWSTWRISKSWSTGLKSQFATV